MRKPHLIAHELHHIKQFWATLGLYRFSARLRFRSEAAAYAVGVDYGQTIETATRGLSDPIYDHAQTKAECREEIASRLKMARLF